MLDRVALRRHHHASTVSRVEKPADPRNTLEPALVAAIVALAPLGATYQGWRPRYDPSDARIVYGGLRDGFRRITPDDPALPAGARSAARRAIEAGWAVHATMNGDAVVINAARNGQTIALRWSGGHFAAAWSPTHERLGLRAATALL